MQAANLTLSFDLHCTNINFDEEFRAYQEVVEMEKNKRPIGYIALLSNKGHKHTSLYIFKFQAFVYHSANACCCFFFKIQNTLM